ncbi:DUF4835 family protein [Ferruginibacter sp. SUN002]|uniref:type IX secretion system protein PorD n=1 Tax=Ferruginibacter sp. SUN002 TaxID=2937789 RepID=UPI003D35B2F8
MYKVKYFVVLLLISRIAVAQELNARVTINSSAVNRTVNKNVFLTLQSSMTNFLNNRKWSTEVYLPSEKIDCSFIFNIESTDETNVYKASLTVQAARPVFNSTYLSPIVNYQDKDVSFKYIEFQQLEFNDNRVAGSDAQISNLTAILAYYAYMIVGFDKDSYSSKGGTVYFQKAQNIVNTAPESRNISGWKAFDGIRNRYWLSENMLNSRYTVMHDVYYNYYRKCLDKMYEDEKLARQELMGVLNLLTTYNSDNPNTMINQFFFQGKATELIKIFSKASPQDKVRASEILQKLDITNAGRYKDELK